VPLPLYASLYPSSLFAFSQSAPLCSLWFNFSFVNSSSLSFSASLRLCGSILLPSPSHSSPPCHPDSTLPVILNLFQDLLDSVSFQDPFYLIISLWTLCLLCVLRGSTFPSFSPWLLILFMLYFCNNLGGTNLSISNSNSDTQINWASVILSYPHVILLKKIKTNMYCVPEFLNLIIMLYRYHITKLVINSLRSNDIIHNFEYYVETME